VLVCSPIFVSFPLYVHLADSSPGRAEISARFLGRFQHPAFGSGALTVLEQTKRTAPFQ